MDGGNTINNDATDVSQPLAPQEQPAPQVPPVSQPVSQTSPRAPSSTPTNPAPKKKTFLIIGIIIGFLILVGVAIAVIVLGPWRNDGDIVSLEKVRDYCIQNDLSISDMTDNNNPTEQGIMCNEKTKSTAVNVSLGEKINHYSDVYLIQYYIFDKSVSEVEELTDSVEMVAGLMDPLVDSENYKKYYLETSEGVMYSIINGRSYLLVEAVDNDSAKSFLIGLGYPDDEWGTEGNYYEKYSDNSSYEGVNSSELQISQRNTQRRNDISRLDTSLIQYRTNNEGKLPVGPSYWEGAVEIKCVNTNEACKFVRDYMNAGTFSNDKENEFLDPDGTPYSLYIADNWYENGTITSTFGNSDSYLIGMSEGFTIGGESPFEQHVIYVIPGSVCNKNDEAVKSNSEKHYAIMYQMEDDTVYCLDSQ